MGKPHQNMTDFQKKVDLEFTTLRFYKNYVLSHPREGVIIDEPQVADLVKICLDYFSNEKFVFLSYRSNDFNVNPLVYTKLENISNLAGIGVVCSKASSLNMAKFESKFSKIPYATFLDFDKAKDWIKILLQ